MSKVSSVLCPGDFIRVKLESDFRAGEDGMVVVGDDQAGEAALIFLYDRSGQPNATPPYAGIEAWNICELDLLSLARN